MTSDEVQQGAAEQQPLPVILVVDDTEDNLDLLEFALKKRPVKMLRASSGRECLQIAAAKQPDIIVLDIQMPEMDGFETLEHLKEDPLTVKIPVVFLTAAKKDPESIERGLTMGAMEYLTKPIDVEELLVRVRTLIKIRAIEKELEATKAKFMAMLVHDLRSPLVGIRSVLEILQETLREGMQLGEPHVELLDSAQESASHMLALINDLLDLSKYQAGNINLELDVVPIPSVIASAIRQISIRFAEKGVELQTDVADNLPQLKIDARKIDQVVMNLVTNALKFTPKGGRVTVAATFEPSASAEGPPMIRVSVTDTGVGIKADEISLLFEQYRQVSSARKTKEKGTGLGLAICKLIVEAHRGTIGVQSEPGKGSTFSFVLPVSS